MNMVAHLCLRAPLDDETRTRLVVSDNGNQPDRLIGMKFAAIEAAESHMASRPAPAGALGTN